MPDTTRYITTARPARDARHPANPPVYHASTVCFPSYADLLASHKEGPGVFAYGRMGTPTIFALQEAVAEVEGGYRSLVCPSGLAAITASLLAFARPGGTLLVTDCVYAPTRHFCDTIMARLGVSTTYFDPRHPDPASLVTDATLAVFLESPGSLTLEFQDTPAWAEVCSSRGIPLLMDNTWSSPALFTPFAHGANVSIHAATKYIVGHSDAMLGIITTDEHTFTTVNKTVFDLGLTAGPDDCYLGLRGLRTLGLRMERHQDGALAVAEWLQSRPDVRRVLHPAFSGHPGHDIWERDYLGASGLFSFIIDPCTTDQLGAMLDPLELFSLGYSFGGFESLALPVSPGPNRTAVPWTDEGQVIRLSIGLEDPSDLIADLEEGFARLARARG